MVVDVGGRIDDIFNIIFTEIDVLSMFLFICWYDNDKWKEKR